jgi:hypothetical protein
MTVSLPTGAAMRWAELPTECWCTRGVWFLLCLHPRVNTSPALFVAVWAQGFLSFCGRRSMRQTREDRCWLPSGNRHESLSRSVVSLAFSFSLWSPVLPSCCTFVTGIGNTQSVFVWAILCYRQIEDKSNPKRKKNKKTKDKSNTARLSQIWLQSKYETHIFQSISFYVFR